MQHVFTAIGGFGIRVIPRAPFQARVDEPLILDVEVGGRKRARVVATADGHHVALGPETDDPAEVMDVVPGPPDREWLLQTARTTLRFPRTYVLHSVEDGSPSPFDLLGDEGELIYMQPAPDTISVDDMLAPGQRETDRAGEIIEASYEHEGAVWCQRHIIVRLGVGHTRVLTLQATEAQMAHARPVLAAMARSARVTPV